MGIGCAQVRIIIKNNVKFLKVQVDLAYIIYQPGPRAQSRPYLAAQNVVSERPELAFHF